jgi:hypothetical protein
MRFFNPRTAIMGVAFASPRLAGGGTVVAISSLTAIPLGK